MTPSMTDFDHPLQQEISLLSTFDDTRIVVAANVGFDGLLCGGARKGQKADLGRPYHECGPSRWIRRDRFNGGSDPKLSLASELWGPLFQKRVDAFVRVFAALRESELIIICVARDRRQGVGIVIDVLLTYAQGNHRH